MRTSDAGGAALDESSQALICESSPASSGRGLIVDLFCGGGGASAGLADAYGAPDIAIDHDPIAIAVHRSNHPEALHIEADIFEVDPLLATRGRAVDLIWASPDCRDHSAAKGGRVCDARVRGLAWAIVRWAYAVRPRLICMENVPELLKWGPLTAAGLPDASLRGRTFESFRSVMGGGLSPDHPDLPEILGLIGQAVPLEAILKGLGYASDFRVLVAADYGAPTTRKRLYGVFRRDGRQPAWPAPVRANPIAKRAGRGQQETAPTLPAWRSAAECIDFADLGKSIFGRAMPLVDASQKRIALGCWKYVLTNEHPFIMPEYPAPEAPDAALDGHASQGDARAPALVAAAMIHCSHGGKRRGDGTADVLRPVQTVTARGSGGHSVVGFNLAASFLEQANGGFSATIGRALDEPMSTLVGTGTQQRLVSAYMVKHYSGGGQLQSLFDPMRALTTRLRDNLVGVVSVRADLLPQEQMRRARRCARFLRRWLPEHFAEPIDLVLLGDYVLVDITLRTLRVHELRRAQGFDDGMNLRHGLFRNPVTGDLTARPVPAVRQIRLIGNAVCPQVAAALVRANLDAINELDPAGS